MSVGWFEGGNQYLGEEGVEISGGWSEDQGDTEPYEGLGEQSGIAGGDLIAGHRARSSGAIAEVTRVMTSGRSEARNGPITSGSSWRTLANTACSDV